jgi:hypothetical protein
MSVTIVLKQNLPPFGLLEILFGRRMSSSVVTDGLDQA